MAFKPRIEGGYLYAGVISGIPVRLHWSLPLIGLLISGFRFEPLIWGAMIGVVLWHELGHAAVVRLVGARVTAIDLAAWGGLCRWRGEPTPVGRVFIAWGGVLAQGVLALAAWGVFALIPPETAWQHTLAWTLVAGNLRMALFNLIPIPPLDGATCWKALPELWRWWKRKRAVAAAAPKVDKRAVERDVRELLDRTARDVNVKGRGDA